VSARADIAAHFTSDTLADQLLNAYRDDVLRGMAAEIKALGDERAWSIWAAHYMHPDVEFVDTSAVDTEEKATAPAATATPRLYGRRLAMLLDAIRTHQGRWTTSRVQQLYRLPGINAPQRGTARRDLHALHAMGHLVLCGPDNGRYYLLARKDGRS
jgi:hypothetical protein